MTTTISSQTISKGDSTVTISKSELKQINLIFLEHSKLLQTDSIMKLQIDGYKRMLSLSDSIQQIQDECLNNCFTENKLLNDKVKTYKDENKNLKKAVGGVTIVAIVSILFHLF
jgi:hypothetical protein